MKYLFHGSTCLGLKELQPFRKTTPGELCKTEVPESVYATDQPLAAVMFSFPWRSQEGIDITVFKGTLKIIVPALLEPRLRQPIVVYRLDAKYFSPIPNVSQQIRNFWSQQIVPIEGAEEFADVLSGIQHFGGKFEFI